MIDYLTHPDFVNYNPLQSVGTAVAARRRQNAHQDLSRRRSAEGRVSADSRHLQFGGHRSGHGAYRAARRHHLRVESAQGAKDFILQRTWVAAVAAIGAHTVAGRGEYGDGELSVPGKAFQIHQCQHWRHLVRSDTRHIPPQIELSRTRLRESWRPGTFPGRKTRPK